MLLPARITEAEYLRVAWPGRGVRLTRSARKAVWAVAEPTGASHLHLHWLEAYDYDQAEFDEVMPREHSLLYVAATRARDELVISYHRQRSELLPADPA